MFPTHVGIARDASCAGERRKYVPYACGDCASVLRSRPGKKRCSLRMWGLRVRGRGAPDIRAMFPTHVGIARMRCVCPTMPWDVPYACGDCADVGDKVFEGAGCSLRMWGLRGRGRCGQAVGRMFPTHVGIARKMRQLYRQDGNVPYACGDCAAVNDMGWRLKACSLRMWGLRANATIPIALG